MGRWGDWEIGRKTERESFTGRRTGKNGPEKRTGKDGSAERLGRNAQSGETLSREKCSGKTIQKKHGGRKFCAQPKAGSTVVEGGTSEKIL